MIELKPTRYACKADLAYYFKKKDLLGGLSELEKLELRKNIGAEGSNDVSTISEITYELLNNLILSKKLIPGKRYIIKDFQTIYSSNVFNNNVPVSWGHNNSDNPSKILSITVTAVTESRLDPRVIINDELTKSWHIEYDPEQKTLPDNIKTKGSIVYLKDDNNNSAYYDFKNIKFRRTKNALKDTNLIISSSYIDLFTFSNIDNGIVTDSSEYDMIRTNILKTGCFNNVFIGDFYNNVFDEDCRDNTFIRGAHDNTFKWNTFNNIFNEAVCYTEGSLYNKFVKIGNTDFSMTINKTIHKVNEATILSYLDPITYAHQIIIL